MSLAAEPGPQRRRGAALESALLDAAWAVLNERGYDDFTVDAVATRAGTSRAVLYRRWSGKPALVLAALARAVKDDVIEAPDTGSLRGDVIAVLRRTNTKRAGLAVLMITRLGSFYDDAQTSLAEIDAFVRGGGREDVMADAIGRAIGRGEITAGQISQRLARLPVNLFRYELLTTLKPLPDEAIDEIVDTIFMPLVRLGSTAK